MPQSESAIYIKKQLNTIFKNPTIKPYMFYLLVFYNTQQLIKLYLYFLFLVPNITEYINQSSICTEREREMSSSEEERLVQMIEDFIESESPSPILSASSTCLPLNYHTQYLTLQVYMFFLVFIIYLFCWFPLCVCVCVCERETEREREREIIYVC